MSLKKSSEFNIVFKLSENVYLTCEVRIFQTFIKRCKHSSDQSTLIIYETITKQSKIDIKVSNNIDTVNKYVEKEKS